MQELSYEANRVAKEEYHLRRRTIYRTSDCVHMGTSLQGHYGGKFYYYFTSLPPLRISNGLWGGWVPSNLTGCVEVIWTFPRGGGFRIDVDSWAVFDVGCDNVIPVSMVYGSGVWGVEFDVEVSGTALGMGKQDCWCFKFPEESAISQGNSTWSVNSDTVLVVGEGLNDLTCCVSSAGCWSFNCNYLSLLKGA